MAYINVDEVYILDNTGLQVDMATDIPFADAGFTDTQKEQARKNIGAGGTNPNLLDNPFFTVNQRGVAAGTSVNANGFVADRWQATGTMGATRNSDGSITVVNTMFHKLGDRGLDGKTVTLSALYTDGTVESKTFTWSGTTAQNLPSLNATVYAASNQINFNGGSLNVKALKLELGTVSTLANDTPPNYAEELAKCQYYCRVLTASSLSMAAVGMAVAATEFRCAFPFVMRTMPTVTFSGTIQGNTSTVSAISTNGTYSGATSAVALRFTTTGLTASAPVILYIGADASITLSADL